MASASASPSVPVIGQRMRSASPGSDATVLYNCVDDGTQDVPVFPTPDRAELKSAMDAMQEDAPVSPPPRSGSPSLLEYATRMKTGADAAAGGDTAPTEHKASSPPADIAPPRPGKRAADAIEAALHGPLPDAAKRPCARRLFRKYGVCVCVCLCVFVCLKSVSAQATLEHLSMRIHFHETRPVADDADTPLRLVALPTKERRMGVCGHCDQGPTLMSHTCTLCNTSICGPDCSGATACAHCTRVSGCAVLPSVQNQCNGCSRFFCGVEHRMVACVHDVVGNWCLDCIHNKRVDSYCPCLEEVLGICSHRNVWVSESSLVHCDVCGMKCIDPALNGASMDTTLCGEPGCKCVAACSLARGDQCRICERALCPTHIFKNAIGEVMCTVCSTKALESYTAGQHSLIAERLGKVRRFRNEIRNLQLQVKDSDTSVREILPAVMDPASGGADNSLLSELLRNVQTRFDAQQAALRAMGDMAEAAIAALTHYGDASGGTSSGAGRDPTPNAPARRA